MSERTELLGEAFRRMGNPFILCQMVSLRARQLLSANSQWDGREAITQALKELVAECLEFQVPSGFSWPRRDKAEGRKHAQEVQPVQVASPPRRAGVEARAI